MSLLDEREQRYAYLAAGFGAALSVALWAPAFGKAAGVALGVIGLIMSALLALAARTRRRLLTGAAAVLLAFGPWGMAWVLGLPFLVLAGWLAIRAPRPQPRLAHGADGGDQEVRGDGRRKGRRRRRRVPADGSVTETPPSPRAGPPPASKRYTPPQRRT